MVALQLKYESNWAESYIYVTHLYRPFFRESLREFIFSRLNEVSINLLVVYRESVNLIGYITRRLSADSQQLWIANDNRSPI